ncbi:hypothetical protein [Streptomyces sp. NPDC001985]|uniref:hypothetical protein n=1 Tax=Streptomyces sp. NPDC001985 TaxID=3154406 RepID=UPI00331B1C61
MARDIKAIDEALVKVEKELKEGKDETRSTVTRLKNSETHVAEISKSFARRSETVIEEIAKTKAYMTDTKVSIARTEALITETKVGIALTDADITQTKADIALTEVSISKTKADIALTEVDISRTDARITQTYAEWSHSKTQYNTALVGLGGTLALLTATIALFKVDEKGITILGATREWGGPLGRLWKRALDKVEEKWASKAQKRKRRRDAWVADQIDKAVLHYNMQLGLLTDRNWAREINKIRGASEALRNAQGRSQQQQVANAPVNRSGTTRVIQGVDHAQPQARGVAADVRVLRDTLNQLITILA